MLDLRNELQGLMDLYRGRADRTRGAAIGFCGVRSGDGVSTCARAFACMVAPQSHKGVWLFDLDFYGNGQYGTFASPQAVRLYGDIGAPLDPSLDQMPFWRVSPALVRASGRAVQSNWYLGLHRVGQYRLFVTRFRSESLRDGQRVHVTRAPDYWQRLRDAIDLAIVDVPARDRARTVLGVASDLDGIVLVASADVADNEIVCLVREIEAVGGKCLGIIYNQRRANPGSPGWQTGA